MSFGNDPVRAPASLPSAGLAAARKAWATPRVIVSTLSSDTMSVSKSTPSIFDHKIGGTTTIGS
jgi:hypothetical protein